MKRTLLPSLALGSVIALGSGVFPAAADETRPTIDVSEGYLATVQYGESVDHLVVVPVRFICEQGLRYRVDLVLNQNGGLAREGSSSHTCSGSEEVMSLGFGHSATQEFQPGTAEVAASVTILHDDVAYWGASVSKEITLVNVP